MKRIRPLFCAAPRTASPVGAPFGTGSTLSGCAVVGDTLVRMVRVGSANRAVKNEVETNIGSLSQTAMHNLMVQRMNLQRFIGMAYQKSHADLIEKNPFIARFLMPRIMAEYGFGGTSKPELLFSWLHRHEARKMGIVVSD